jgi:hypothetical protein
MEARFGKRESGMLARKDVRTGHDGCPPLRLCGGFKFQVAGFKLKTKEHSDSKPATCNLKLIRVFTAGLFLAMLSLSS